MNGYGYIDDAGVHLFHEGDGEDGNWADETVRDTEQAEPMPECQPPLGDPVSEDVACDGPLSDEEFVRCLKGLGTDSSEWQVLGSVTIDTGTLLLIDPVHGRRGR